jgi:hypothetical protein
MSLVEQPAEQRAHSWTAKAFLGVVALTVLAYGSVAEAPLDLEVIAFALLAMLSLRYPVGSVAIGRLQAATILLLAGLLLYVALQTLPFAAGDFVNVAWKSVNELVGPFQGTISVSPGMTFDAIPTLAMPFLVFFCALALFQSDAEALRLWRALALFRSRLCGPRHFAGAFFPRAAATCAEKILSWQPDSDLRQPKYRRDVLRRRLSFESGAAIQLSAQNPHRQFHQ